VGDFDLSMMVFIMENGVEEGDMSGRSISDMYYKGRKLFTVESFDKDISAEDLCKSAVLGYHNNIGNMLDSNTRLGKE